MRIRAPVAQWQSTTLIKWGFLVRSQAGALMNYWAFAVLIGSQLIFTTSDFLGRMYMPKYGFTLQSFLSPWFVVYFIIRIFATLGQLYLFTQTGLGRTISLFGALGLIFANSLGFFVFHETLSPLGYVGVTLAIIAFILMAFA